MRIQLALCIAAATVLAISISAYEINYSTIEGQVTAAVPACFEEAVTKMSAKFNGKPDAKKQLCKDTCTRPNVENPAHAPKYLDDNQLLNCVQNKVYGEQGMTPADIAALQKEDKTGILVNIRTYVQYFATRIACNPGSDSYCRMNANDDSTLKYILESLGGKVDNIRLAVNTKSAELEPVLYIAYETLADTMDKYVDECVQKKYDAAAGDGKSYKDLPKEAKDKAKAHIGESICKNWLLENPSHLGYKIWICLEFKIAPELVGGELEEVSPGIMMAEKQKPGTLPNYFQNCCPNEVKQRWRRFTWFYATKLVCAKLGQSLSDTVKTGLKAQAAKIQAVLDIRAQQTGVPAKKVVP